MRKSDWFILHISQGISIEERLGGTQVTAVGITEGNELSEFISGDFVG